MNLCEPKWFLRWLSQLGIIFTLIKLAQKLFLVFQIIMTLEASDMVLYMTKANFACSYRVNTEMISSKAESTLADKECTLYTVQ
jgi:hypothetical protein